MSAPTVQRFALGVLASLSFAALLGCGGLGDRRAESLVRRYNEKLIEAYRMGDERIVEGLVSDDEANKILGLVGVKSDMGIALDAALTEFRVLRFERPSKGVVDVLTEERWHYRDRKIGTGETVGQESEDHYFMRYSLRREKGRWVVGRVAFDRPPEVGRKAAPTTAPPKVFHGMAAGPVPGRDAAAGSGPDGRKGPP